MASVHPTPSVKSPSVKTALQEWCQKRGLPLPNYITELVHEAWSCRLHLSCAVRAPVFEGQHALKKEAETMAAQKALEWLEQQNLALAVSPPRRPDTDPPAQRSPLMLQRSFSAPTVMAPPALSLPPRQQQQQQQQQEQEQPLWWPAEGADSPLQVVGLLGRAVGPHGEVCGVKGVGKDTTACLLRDLLVARGHHVHVMALAQPLKQMVQRMYGLTDSQLETAEGKKQCVFAGWTPRRLLEVIGTEVRQRVHAQTWIRLLDQRLRAVAWGDDDEIHQLIRQIEPYMTVSPDFFPPLVEPQTKATVVIVTDVRYANEVCYLRAGGALLVTVERSIAAMKATEACERLKNGIAHLQQHGAERLMAVLQGPSYVDAAPTGHISDQGVRMKDHDNDEELVVANHGSYEDLRRALEITVVPRLLS